MAEQTLSVPPPAPAEAVVILEVPRIGSRFRDWQIEITESTTGEMTHLHYEAMRAKGAVYGVSTMRVPFGRLVLTSAGAYGVRIAGLAGGEDLSRCCIILSRPYLGRMVLQIIGIVFCGIGLLLSLLLGAWQLFPLQTA